MGYAYSSNSSLSTSLSSLCDSSCEEVTPPAYANALHIAIEYDAIDVTKLLLRCGIDPESIGIPDSFETDNNLNVTPSAVIVVPTENSNDARVCGGDIVYPDGSSVSSKSGSNNSSNYKVYCPSQVPLRGVPSPRFAKSSPSNSQKSSAPLSTSSPQKWSADSSPLRACAARANAERLETPQAAPKTVKDSGNYFRSGSRKSQSTTAYELRAKGQLHKHLEFFSDS